MIDHYGAAQRIEQIRDAVPSCAWFALCGRAATGTSPHPVLGYVPTCNRHHRRATSR